VSLGVPDLMSDAANVHSVYCKITLV